MRLAACLGILAFTTFAGCVETADRLPGPFVPEPLYVSEVPLDTTRAVLQSNGTSVLAHIDLNQAAWDDGNGAFFGVVVETPANVTASLLIATYFPGRPGAPGILGAPDQEVKYNFQAFPSGATTTTMRSLTYGDDDQPQLAIAFASHGGPAKLNIGLVPYEEGIPQYDLASRVLGLPAVFARPDSGGPQLQAGTSWRVNRTDLGDIGYSAGELAIETDLGPVVDGLQAGTTRFSGALAAREPGVVAMEYYMVSRPFYGTFSVELDLPDGKQSGGGPIVENSVAEADIATATALQTAGFSDPRCFMQAFVGGPGDIRLALEQQSQAQGEERQHPLTGELAVIRIVTWGFYGGDLAADYGWPIAPVNECANPVP
jgi:hypothetical protein